MNYMQDIFKHIGDNDANQDVKDWLSTGFLPLNHAISGLYDGGFPVGRISEVFGAESCGKTLLLTMAMRETQRKGGIAMLLDFEHAFSISRAIKLGLSDDPMQWIYKQPATAEEGFAAIEYVANTVHTKAPETYVTIGIDSTASMCTKEELTTDYGEANMRTRNSLPMVMSECLKKLAAMVNRTNVTLIFLNQLRDNPGVTFGDKEKTPGGRAMKFYASTRIKLRKQGKLKDGTDVIGESVMAQVIKNKVSAPFREASYVSTFEEGINLHLSHIDAAVDLKLIDQAGSYLVWGGKKMYRSALEKKLRAEPAEYAKLLDAYRTGEVLS